MLRKFSLSCVAALLVLSVSGCKSAKKSDETEVPGAGGGVTETNMPTSDDNAMGDSDSGRAMGLKTVYFELDSSALDAGQKAILNANADILKTNTTAKIQVEGHCDARGGIQYNLALGEKRATAVKNYLQSQGITADRLSTISYGKERLVDTAMSEEAHAKNRRANFAVTSR